MLAAVENERPRPRPRSKRAVAILDQGLEVMPDAARAGAGQVSRPEGRRPIAGRRRVRRGQGQGVPQGPFRRELVEMYREQKDYDQAEQLLRELLRGVARRVQPGRGLDPGRVARGAEAAARNQPDRQRELNDRAASMIREYRARFPNNLVFLQAECDMAARRGDFTRAIELTREIDKLSKTSPMGPTLAGPAVRGAQDKPARAGPGLQRGPRAQPRASSSCACCSARPS